MKMAVFYSFHYDRDSWRVQQVVNMGSVEGQKILNSQEWESVKRQGKAAIEKWIDDKMQYKSAVVVLIGAQTAGRQWVEYEIVKAWNDKRPLLGIQIHGLADQKQQPDSPGGNPFAKVSFPSGGTLADYVPIFTPTGSTSTQVHASMKASLATWVTQGYKRN